ncbi:sialidase-3-like isoform X4 [Brachyhypopomus gauderio]|uniref:sialidase-3-like isoform X4 n=1 Tax=Brachyhypopomus gauderio TaxID=698409 RepID=UPI00404242F2
MTGHVSHQLKFPFTYVNRAQIRWLFHTMQLHLEKNKIKLGQNSAMGNKPPKSSSPALPGEPPKTTLFKQEPDGTTYRIPSLIYISDCQTLLAFAEKRRTPRDCDAKILVMRRGKQQTGSVQWSPAQELTAACLPGYRTMNPCPVYERQSQTLFLFFICVLDNVTEGHQICTASRRAR